MKKNLYIENESLIHKLDPRTKTISMCIIFLISIIITDICLLLVMMLILVLLTIYSGSTPNLLRIKWLVIIISVMSILFWIPSKSLSYGIIVALRLDLMLLAGILFVSSIHVEEFSTGLNRLGLPYRVAFSVSLAFRLIPSLFSVIQGTFEAQRTRGLNLKEGNIVKRAKKYIPLFIPVISIMVKDAHRLSMALESKGFGFSNKRVNYIELSMKKLDYIVLTLLFMILLNSLFLKRIF